MRPLLMYVSGHGFGHADRGYTVPRALRHRHPALPFVLRTPVPRWILRDELGETCPTAPVQLDVGVVQRDSLSLDTEATLVAAVALLAQAPRLIAEEAAVVAPLLATYVCGEDTP